MSYSNKNLAHQTAANRTSLTLILFAALVVASCRLVVHCEPEPGNASAGSSMGSLGGDSGSGNEQFASSPKRQFNFIAPRIGRSPGGGNMATIWSALEEAALQTPGQVQPHRGFPGPLRSSLLFLVSGNRRTIGPRSGGLLPQARIGRRAAPIGLMPQPRVGRRAPANERSSSFFIDESSAMDGSEPEVAVATYSDSSFNDALESLVASG